MSKPGLKKIETPIPGCFRFRTDLFTDQRGTFLKPFQASRFKDAGLGDHFQEIYFSKSFEGVVRGFHFQVPPEDHYKLVSCIDGKVMDVLVDLRVGSPVFGKAFGFELDSYRGDTIYMPSGVAHGFRVMSREALLLYCVSAEHSADHDRGILWNSVDFNWGIEDPVLSDRDRGFPSLSEFKSPFRFEGRS